MDEQAIERLIRSEQSYRSLAECSIQGILVHGIDGGPLYANPAFARLLGYDSPAQILALDFAGESLVAEHDRARLRAYSRTASATTGAPEECEFDALTRDGALRRLRARVTTTHWQGSPAVLATMVDVTAQRGADARFQALVEGSIHGIGILDTDWKPLFVNQAYATLFGYSSTEEVLALDSVEALIAPDDVARMRGYARARRDGAAAPELYEFQGVCRDGNRRPLLNSARRIDWDGRPALQVTLTDLTELRVAERALRDSEQRLAEANTMLHLVLDTIPDRVFWKDRDGRFLGCNRSFAADAGRNDPADLIGRTDEEMSWGGDSEKYRADDARVCETGEPMLGFEELQTRRGGSQFWVRTSKVAMRNPAGDVIGILGTYRHITNEKRAQEALRASEERYALAVQGSTDGIWDWDIERGTIYYSPRLLEIAGFARGREIQSGEDVLASIHEDDRPGYRAALSAHLRGQTDVFRLAFRIRADDGTIRWVLDRGVALRSPGGRAYRMAGSVVDITEQRRADQELERYRGQLEELVAERTAELRAAQSDLLRSERLATLGELTAAVSHELRNPLGTIHASCETLRRRSPPSDDANRRALARIERSIARCVKVIEELLGYARLREPVRRNIRVDDAVGEIVERFSTRPGIAVSSDLCSGARMPIDEELIRLALENVLRNAEQALEARESGRIEVRTRPSGPGAQITIVDDGPGIDPTARERAFEPLFSTRSFGVGLGLPVARHILEQHGGSLEISASGPAGTTVALWLPGHSRLGEPARRR